MSLIKHSLPCDACGSSDAKAVYENNEYCFSCHTSWQRYSLLNSHPPPLKPFSGSLPSDFTLNLPEKAIVWFKVVGIDDDVVNKYNIGYSKKEDAVVFPYFDKDVLVGYQLKYLFPSDIKYRTTGSPRPFICENEEEGCRTVCIVEDIRSALKISPFCTAIALGGTKLSKKYKPVLLQAKQLFIWLDGDGPGVEGGKDLYDQVAHAVPTQLIYTPKDPKCYSNEEIKHKLRGVV